jgi:hypothetical protein
MDSAIHFSMILCDWKIKKRIHTDCIYFMAQCRLAHYPLALSVTLKTSQQTYSRILWRQQDKLYGVFMKEYNALLGYTIFIMGFHKKSKPQ